jgi:cytochrome c-type biogenesis protein CcmH/NrfF
MGRRYNCCIARFSNRIPGDPRKMTLTALLWLLLPLLAVVALVDLATMSTERRVRLLRTAGMSQTAIAARLGCSRYRVRVALAA